MLKRLFFLLWVKPLILLGMGLHIRGRENLLPEGPYIIAANHNSHLDTLILMSLFSLSSLKKVHPVAAADYFLKNRYLKWFALNIIGIIPIKRQIKVSKQHPLQGAIEALERREILIIFPEGSRGEPERFGNFKTGVAHLAKSLPDIPIVPVNLHGAGKSLPRGEALFVPFIVDISIGVPIFYQEGSTTQFTQTLEASIKVLQRQSGNSKEKK